jgi:hypothetical protein
MMMMMMVTEGASLERIQGVVLNIDLTNKYRVQRSISCKLIYFVVNIQKRLTNKKYKREENTYFVTCEESFVDDLQVWLECLEVFHIQEHKKREVDLKKMTFCSVFVLHNVHKESKQILSNKCL